MSASTLIKLINTFELHSVGHRTLGGAMIASFGFEWESVPEYREVANYVSKCMTYDEISGDWY